MPKKFLENRHLEDFRALVRHGETLLVEELWDAPKALLASIAQGATGKHIVIITGGIRESRLFDDFAYFHEGPVHEFPAWETLPSEEIPPSPDIVGERYQILRGIQENTSPRILLTSLQAALQKLLPPHKLQALHLVLKKGDDYPFEALPPYLSEMGYHRKPVAVDKGEFAVRGGILDIFPVSSPDPVRIEFWEDEIVSIRKYDPVGQVSVGKIDDVLITPGEELELLQQQESLATLFDYLGPETLVIFDDLLALEDKYVALKTMAGAKHRSFSTLGELLETLKTTQKLYFTETPITELSEVRIIERPHTLAFHAFNTELRAKRWHNPFLPLFPTFCPPEISLDNFSVDDLLKSLASKRIPVEFLCANASEETSLRERVKELQATFTRGYLSSGFFLEDPPFALIPMTELTHRYKVRRQKQRSHYHTLPVEMLTLNSGETVVHMNSGIGRYLGIERRPNHIGVETEYMLIEYAEGAKLYVPMDQANLVSKYIGATDETPSLHALGSTRWKRSVERTEMAIQGYAQDLLQLQAERELKGGFTYPPDSDLVTQFGSEFPYVETPDQREAIEKVRLDMLSSSSMDRLICGDVGYGKTEVAMRAAFKAVVDGGKQVALLVPTTVLAMQHYDTFCERMGNFPIKIGILSRFRKPKELKQTLEEAAAGTVDILIGTHRIVSRDVAFRDLGLVIIDEEQRFGVRAKEHLKKLKQEVDCLTLSATPIPRTLYMSLVGARDLSLINTPPEDRLPIQTIVCQGTDEVLKNALLRELNRDGQAYVIHNRVESIFSFADRIRTLIPEARIAVGHGQMSANELDTVFHAFKSGQADILVATSIIENGIDIPNANTILVDRADRFGLADLYQIRGRVGRWNKKAYCYFLVPSTQTLSEISRKRLSALAQSSGHGGGMKIAMHDLEIRGAGNILGVEQSGHVATIGFQLYCKLLRKTINRLKKKGAPLSFTDVKIEIPFDARLPDDYVNAVSLRMEFYQRLGDAESEEEVDALMGEIEDRFGPFPPQVSWLHRFSRLRVFAARSQFTLLKLTKTLLHAEQSHGKKEKISRKLLMPLPQTPEELETQVIETLKAHFPINTKYKK